VEHNTCGVGALRRPHGQVLLSSTYHLPHKGTCAGKSAEGIIANCIIERLDGWG